MKTLYFECNSGISGDMVVSALLDLGADEAVLRKALASLPFDGYSIEIGRRNKSGIDAAAFDVILHPEHSHEHGGHSHNHAGHNHGHDHTHSHNHSHGHDHEHKHDEHKCEHNHAHNHGHERSHAHEGKQHDEHEHGHGHSHNHEHRNLQDVEKIIDAGKLTANARCMAKEIFRVVAEAEAKVHGKPITEVHFHEVGAIDSIVDIVGAAVCIDNLDVRGIVCSPLREGTGYVRCQHGLMPVPAPATLEIARAHKIPLIITENKGEMVTPTGIAIVAALAQKFDVPEGFTLLGVGYGSGKKDFKTANILRAMMIEENEKGRDTVRTLECNLDDMSGEELAYACEILMEAGALDVWCTPILMKKGRPAQMLSVLCEPALEAQLCELIFKHTSTLGIRVCEYRRHVMNRHIKEINTPYGAVPVKEAKHGSIVKEKAEFEVVKRFARERNLSLRQVLRAVHDAETEL